MRKIILLLFITFSSQSFAINVGPMTLFIGSKTDIISNTIKNTTDEARVVLVKVVEVSEPTKDGVVLNEHPKNLLLSPSKILLPALSEENVKFFYKGKKDNKERYYRVIWIDSNISVQEKDTSKKRAIATSSAIIGTILVVSPRNEDFKYEFISTDNILINKGNTSYHVVGYGRCLTNKKERCKEDYYDLPGTKRSFKKIDLKDDNSFIGIWHDTNFITIK